MCSTRWRDCRRTEAPPALEWPLRRSRSRFHPSRLPSLSPLRQSRSHSHRRPMPIPFRIPRSSSIRRRLTSARCSSSRHPIRSGAQPLASSRRCCERCSLRRLSLPSRRREQALARPRSPLPHNPTRRRRARRMPEPHALAHLQPAHLQPVHLQRAHHKHRPRNQRSRLSELHRRPPPLPERARPRSTQQPRPRRRRRFQTTKMRSSI
jgi:hypothetical protein